jgi:hypothetical protein
MDERTVADYRQNIVFANDKSGDRTRLQCDGTCTEDSSRVRAERTSSVRCWQLVSALQWLVTGLLAVLGRAIAQAVSRWFPTAAARVQSQVRSCGICGGQSVTGAGFLRVLRFPLPILIPPTAP